MQKGMDCIFCNIVNKKGDVHIIFEDEISHCNYGQVPHTERTLASDAKVASRKNY